MEFDLPPTSSRRSTPLAETLLRAVADGFVEHAAVLRDGFAEQCQMTLDGGVHGDAVALPQPRRALDVGEEEGDGAAGKVSHRRARCVVGVRVLAIVAPQGVVRS